MPIDPKKIKADFPFFQAHPQAVYLDNAATTQKPTSVLSAVDEFYRNCNANAGRGSYSLSTNLVTKINSIRTQAARFIGCNPEDISFVSGATGAQNVLAQSFLTHLKNGDEILYSPYDHASFVQPWKMLSQQLAHFGIHITLVPYAIKNTGGADIADILSKVSDKTRLINITHIHNIFGSDSNIHELGSLRAQGVCINVDASQSVGHIPVDVHALGADALSFSGHKMFSPFGTGVLYVGQQFRNTLTRTYVGGGVVNGQGMFEAGTLDYAGIVGLGKAIEYVEDIGLQNIHHYISMLTQYALAELKKLPNMEFTKGPFYWRCADGFGIISFNLRGVDSKDVAFFLGERGIMVRAGDHCSTTSDDVTNAVRVSLHVYNSTQDIDRLIVNLKSLL